MAENYKLLYEQMKKIVTEYQDKVVPCLREIIKYLEKNQIKVRCKDCKWRNTKGCPYINFNASAREDSDFCSDGERRTE